MPSGSEADPLALPGGFRRFPLHAYLSFLRGTQTVVFPSHWHGSYGSICGHEERNRGGHESWQFLLVVQRRLRRDVSRGFATNVCMPCRIQAITFSSPTKVLIIMW